MRQKKYFGQPYYPNMLREREREKEREREVIKQLQGTRFVLSLHRQPHLLISPSGAGNMIKWAS